MYVINDERLYYVYKYTSPSGRCYVGRTCNSQNVRSKYKGRGYENCTAFWRAIQKYGWDNFEYEILEDNIPADKIKERENYWIKYYHSSTNENGYNLLMPDEELDTTFSNEALQKMSESHMGQEPWNKGKTGVYSEETLKRMSDVKKSGNSGRTKKQKAEVAKEKRATHPKKYMTNEEIRQKSRERFFGEYDPNDSNLGYHVMPVSQFDLDGNYIKTYKSAVQAAEILGIHSYEIRRCCRGERNIVANFQWCDIGDEEKISKHGESTSKKNRRKGISIAQIKNGTIVNIFPSIVSASKDVGVDKHCIGDAVRGKQKTSAGFQWKKITDIENEILSNYYSQQSKLQVEEGD